MSEFADGIDQEEEEAIYEYITNPELAENHSHLSRVIWDIIELREDEYHNSLKSRKKWERARNLIVGAHAAAASVMTAAYYEVPLTYDGKLIVFSGLGLTAIFGGGIAQYIVVASGSNANTVAIKANKMIENMGTVPPPWLAEWQRKDKERKARHTQITGPE